MPRSTSVKRNLIFHHSYKMSYHAMKYVYLMKQLIHTTLQFNEEEISFCDNYLQQIITLIRYNYMCIAHIVY